MYHVYVLKCSDGTFYTGIAKDLANRLETHRQKKGSKYVAARLPFTLVYSEIQPDRSKASKREAEIKSWTRNDKVKNLGLN